MKKLFVLLFLTLSLNAFSQSTNATVGGTVQDATGAFIPGVTITATNTATGIVTTVISNEAGAYQFASLQPGTYDIKADLAGFQPEVAKSFQLGGAQQDARALLRSSQSGDVPLRQGDCPAGKAGRRGEEEQYDEHDGGPAAHRAPRRSRRV